MKTLILFLAIAAGAFAADPDKAAPDVQVAVNDTDIEVTNGSTKNWPVMEIYLNEVPDGFKYRGPAPTPGSKLHLSLTRFVDKKGVRYDPAKHGATKVWIGGSGRDFQLFNVH